MAERRLKDTRALTGLRFLAAFHVLLLHELPDHINGASDTVNILLERTAALSVFFVLSGLLISLGSGTKSWSRSRARSFLIRRMAKTIPLYYVGFLFFIPIFIYRTEFVYETDFSRVVEAFVANLLNIQSFLPHVPEPWYINRPAWTIGVFLTCYITFPRVHDRLRRWRPSLLVGMFWICFFFSQALVFALELTLDTSTTEIEIIHKFPFVRIFEFYMGVAVGTWLNVKESPAEVPSITVVPTSIAILLLFVFLPIEFDNFIHNGLLTPLFIILFLGSSTGKDRVLDFLRKGPIHRLGEASYSFYIMHLPIANYISAVIVISTGESWRFTLEFILIDLIVVLPLSIWAYSRFEEPWRQRIIARYSDRA
jgi:peptidoglycan/LPS O-acetylase OafA/YrhL